MLRQTTMDRQRELEWAKKKAEKKEEAAKAAKAPKKAKEAKGAKEEMGGKAKGEEGAQGAISLPARVRERPSDAVIGDWTARIRSGESEHGAAALSREALGHVYSVDQLRYQCSIHPPHAALLDAAKEAFLRPLRAAVAAIAAGQVPDDKVARVQLAAAQWLLAKHRPLEYGEHARVEHTGAGGAPIRTEVVMVLADARALARSENPE